jgi:hypothetical protein
MKNIFKTVSLSVAIFLIIVSSNVPFVEASTSYRLDIRCLYISNISGRIHTYSRHSQTVSFNVSQNIPKCAGVPFGTTFYKRQIICNSCRNPRRIEVRVYNHNNSTIQTYTSSTATYFELRDAQHSIVFNNSVKIK